MQTDSGRLARLRVAAHCGNTHALDALAGDPMARAAPDRALWRHEWDDFAADLLKDKPVDPNGRIWFPGNPYPGGHRLENFSITGKLAADSLSLVVRLECVGYGEDDNVEDPEELDDLRDWQSVGVWNNYTRCDFGGTIVRTADRPLLDLSAAVVLEADHQVGDVLVGEPDDLAFWQCYILGHDSIADHTLELTPNDDGSSQMTWDGRVAMTYAGDDSLDHGFWVEHASVPPMQFAVKATETPEALARMWLAQFVTNVSAYTYADAVFSLAEPNP